MMMVPVDDCDIFDVVVDLVTNTNTPHVFPKELTTQDLIFTIIMQAVPEQILV